MNHHRLVVHDHPNPFPPNTKARHRPRQGTKQQASIPVFFGYPEPQLRKYNFMFAYFAWFVKGETLEYLFRFLGVIRGLRGRRRKEGLPAEHAFEGADGVEAAHDAGV
ncbi:MAG: hypothetical protein ACYDBB_23095, partial [Armatimonadota bacterium]